nr:uncharacterized protein LOC113800479 [Penaeus vannamei]
MTLSGLERIENGVPPGHPRGPRMTRGPSCIQDAAEDRCTSRAPASVPCRFFNWMFGTTRIKQHHTDVHDPDAVFPVSMTIISASTAAFLAIFIKKDAHKSPYKRPDTPPLRVPPPSENVFYTPLAGQVLTRLIM